MIRDGEIIFSGTDETLRQRWRSLYSEILRDTKEKD